MRVDHPFFSHENLWIVIPAAILIIVAGLVIARKVWIDALRRLGSIGIMARTIISFVRTPAQVVLLLLALQFVATAAQEELPAGKTLDAAISLLLVAALTWLAIRAIAGFSEAMSRLHPVDTDNNLEARRIHTQTRLLGRIVMFFVLLIGMAFALMMFPGARQIGTSLLASAGLAGLVAGIAARPVLGNLIAGLQIALTQPIRLDDVVIMENEWGRIEEITSTYVVVKIWDERRLIVPLQWVIEHPFQNWTRQTSQLLGTVFLWVDYRVPLEPLRHELTRVCATFPEWDKRVAMIQVVDTNERAIQLRALVSASDAPKAWDLRCHVREALLDFLQREYPESLPHVRAEFSKDTGRVPAMLNTDSASS